MEKRVDFHMHTTHSDGTFTPEDLMRACKEKGLACVAVTDHDTMSSFEDCEREAKNCGIELVPGVEISAVFEPGTLHILGYFLDRNNQRLKNLFSEIQEARRTRNPKIIEKLNALGIEITMEDVIAESGQAGMTEGQLGRPHFAKALLKKGVVQNSKEAFDKYLGKGCPAYSDKRRVTSQEAIEVIHEAGGVASVAHPIQMRVQGEALEKELQRLVDEGLDAIEVYHNSQKPEHNETYAKLAKRFGLVATAGSDFHGANKPGVELGFYGQGIDMGYDMVEALQSRIRK